MARSRRADNSVADSRASRSSHHSSASESAPLDPNMPDWWNQRKKAEQRAHSDARKDEIRAENERRKMAAGNAANYRQGGSGNGVGVAIMNQSDRAKFDAKAQAGAYSMTYDEKDIDDKKRRTKLEMDYMDVHDDRVHRKSTADEELQGRSLKDLVDRGTLMVGCFLILVVVIAVTIPVLLISEDEPYVAPPPPPQPTASPTSPRLPEYLDIFERLAPIAGGPEVLSDPTTAQYRALQWIVYEDGLELGHEKDNLHQRFVLMVIYFISGPWTPVEGRLEWGSPVHECEWEGIFCKDIEELEEELQGRVDELLEVGREDGIKIDVPQRIVNRLELRQRLVSGEVPSEFSLLYYVQHLDLENNQLYGALPTPLYKLFNLQTLFLEQNELTNVDAIGEYRHLEHLALSKNAFQGRLPDSFANLKKLKTLYLHTNAFTGRVFDILKDFNSMELLDLAFNEFSGSLPTELGEMKNLTSIFVGHNKFEGEIPVEIGKCLNLKQFQCDGSQDINGAFPSIFGSLTNLEFIKVDTCSFTGQLPKELGNLKNLTYLDVSSNFFEGKIPTQLGKLENVVTLGLANNDFEGNIPTEFGQLTKLETLKLQNTDLSGVMPDEVCALRSRGNETVLAVLEVPCDVECPADCCTMCS